MSDEITTGGSCWYCGSSIHQDVPCSQRVADADRAVAGFPPLATASAAELTGVEAAAAGTMEALLGLDYTRKELGKVMPRVRKAMAARQALGREKYPTTLAENHAPFEERVRHAWEEALDGLAYSQWMFWGWNIPRPDNPAYNRSGQDYEAGAAMNLNCIRLFSLALVELDRLMRHCNMDPVRKEGQP